MALKPAEIRDLGDGDLVERLDETKQELFNLRFQNVTGQLDNYARLKEIKRDVARLQTELRVREIAAAEALEADEDEGADAPADPAVADGEETA